MCSPTKIEISANPKSSINKINQGLYFSVIYRYSIFLSMAFIIECSNYICFAAVNLVIGMVQ